MYHFDIPKCRQYDTGKIEVIARSSVGEALATTDLTIVERKDDYRGVLKNSPRRKFRIVMQHKLHKFSNKLHLVMHTPLLYTDTHNNVLYILLYNR